MCAHASSAGERGYQRHAASVARPDIITMTITVAIIGRPNVGKSTLFNRLVGQRLALVDDEPGVTRDRREGEANLFGLEFRVVDTAGLRSEEHTSELQSLMRISNAVFCLKTKK